MKLWFLSNSFLVKAVGWVAVIGYFFILLALKGADIQWYWSICLSALAMLANAPFVLYLFAAIFDTGFRTYKFASLFFPSMVALSITGMMFIGSIFVN
ncbi:MAG: hypothetical protein RL497_443 [Pseudomonadota bacterium]|jgi:hypothetical protein